MMRKFRISTGKPTLVRSAIVLAGVAIVLSVIMLTSDGYSYSTRYLWRFAMVASAVASVGAAVIALLCAGQHVSNLRNGTEILLLPCFLLGYLAAFIVLGLFAPIAVFLIKGNNVRDDECLDETSDRYFPASI